MMTLIITLILKMQKCSQPSERYKEHSSEETPIFDGSDHTSPPLTGASPTFGGQESKNSLHSKDNPMVSVNVSEFQSSKIKQSEDSVRVIYEEQVFKFHPESGLPKIGALE